MPTLDSTPLPTVTETLVPSSTPTPNALRLEAGEARYAIPLHLQHKTTDMLVFMFSLEQSLPGRLYWWPENKRWETAASLSIDAMGTPQLVTLSGLQPGTRYRVAAAFSDADGLDRLANFEGEAWGPQNVSTLPSGGLPLKVAVFGDSGFGETITAELADLMAQHEPDLVLHTGDLVYQGFQEGDVLSAYQRKWYATLDSLLATTVIYPVVGNHEYDADVGVAGEPYYFQAFPITPGMPGGWLLESGQVRREWYALEFGPWQLLMLNSQQLYGGSARAEQNAWLSERLEDQRFDATVVIFHIPPFTSGRHQADGAAVLGTWVPLFEASNVVLVLSGHDHNYERLQRAGITYIVSGGGSSVLYPLEEQQPESLAFAAKTHMLLLEITQQSITINALDQAGQLMDQATVALGE